MHEKVERQGLYYRLEQRMSVSGTIVAIAQHQYGELGPRLHEYKYLVHAVKGRDTGAIKAEAEDGGSGDRSTPSTIIPPMISRAGEQNLLRG